MEKEKRLVIGVLIKQDPIRSRVYLKRWRANPPCRVRPITRREQIDSRLVEETRTSVEGCTSTPASVINAFMKIDGLVDCLWADKEITAGHVLRPFIRHVSLRRKRISANHYLFIETLFFLFSLTRHLIFFICSFLFFVFLYCEEDI